MIKTAREYNFSKKPQGFTLVELLVVIAIVAILAAIVVLIINPLELTRRSRDAARLTDLASLQQAINVAVQESTDSAQDILCKTVSAATCQGRSNAQGRGIDGSGWVHVDLGNQNAVSVPTLPVDPQNTANNHYTYCADTSNSGAKWVIFTKLESIQQKDKMANDGGNTASQTPNNEDVYEVGSDLSLTKVGSCTY